MKNAITLTSIALAIFAKAEIPIKWEVETSERNQPKIIEQWAGGSYCFSIEMLTYGRPLEITGVPQLFIQTNGMDDAYWIAPATVSNNVLSARWNPSYELAATTYNCFIGVTGSIFNAAFQLRLKPSPGAHPNFIEKPQRTIDFNHTVVIDPPYYAKFETDQKITDAKTEVLSSLSALSNTVERITPGNYATVSNAAMQAEGRLMAEVGQLSQRIEETTPGNYEEVSNRAVRAVIWESDPTVPNWAKEPTPPISVDSNEVKNIIKDFKSEWFFSGSEVINHPNLSLEWSEEFGLKFWHLKDGNTFLSTIGGEQFENATNLNFNISANPIDIIATRYNLASKGDLVPIQKDVVRIIDYFNGSNVWFSVTNYDSATTLPRMQLRELREGQERIVWDEMSRLNECLSNATERIEQAKDELEARKADRAFGKYTSALGSDAPDNTLWLSSSNIVIASNIEYVKHLSGNGCVWVLATTGITAANTATNGLFAISDDEGNVAFEIRKTNETVKGADASGISVTDNGDGTSTVVIPYGTEITSQPTIFASETLTGDGWKQEGETGFIPLSVAWTESVPYTATVVVGNDHPQLFIKAQYIAPGATIIHNNAPVALTKIVIDGTTYRVAVETISGKKVMTLTED